LLWARKEGRAEGFFSQKNAPRVGIGKGKEERSEKEGNNSFKTEKQVKELGGGKRDTNKKGGEKEKNSSPHRVSQELFCRRYLFIEKVRRGMRLGEGDRSPCGNQGGNEEPMPSVILQEW